jgi:hypothetical protein
MIGNARETRRVRRRSRYRKCKTPMEDLLLN